DDSAHPAITADNIIIVSEFYFLPTSPPEDRERQPFDMKMQTPLGKSTELFENLLDLGIRILG
ncbi:MAG: hypothetical protein ACETWD_00615, partial [Desulfatiglandales bacterium]